MVALVLKVPKFKNLIPRKTFRQFSVIRRGVYFRVRVCMCVCVCRLTCPSTSKRLQVGTREFLNTRGSMRVSSVHEDV